MSDAEKTPESPGHGSVPGAADVLQEAPVTTGEHAAQGGAAEAAGESGPDGRAQEAKRSRTELLEEEGDIAADYLEELLDIADLDGDIDIDVVDGRAHVAVVNEEGGDDLRKLVGADGQVLTALQELTRLTVQAQTGQRSWLMLDVDGYRDRRRNDLRARAQKAVDSVQETGEAVALEPMNSFERKVVHDVVASAGLRSESEGEGDGRHVVVLPA
jgi:spoIIIJ-associated protein